MFLARNLSAIEKGGDERLGSEELRAAARNPLW